MSSPRSASNIWRPLLCAVAVFLAYRALGASMLHDFALGLGSTNAPTPYFGRYLGAWTLFGTALSAAVAVALARITVRLDGRGYGPQALRDAWRESPESKWLIYGSILAGLIPAAMRVWLLRGMPVVDDENAYRFAAEILASGRLWSVSPPMKLFFDNPFLINDGKLYTQYFLGWPALMAPGVWLGIAGFMNAVYSALTAPAVYLVARRMAGASAARVALVLFLAAPMLLVGSATETSHPSCLAALAWTLWFVLRSRDDDAGLRVHAGAAVLFCIAFFIRPTTALGLGTPMLLFWLLGLRGRERPEAAKALLAFAAPAIALAGCFLAVNQVQSGSPFAVGYDAYYEYSKANRFRFSIWPQELEVTIRNYVFSDPIQALGINASALWRLNTTLLGWPFSLLFLAFARGAAARLLWGCIACFGVVHFFTNSVGVDTYAPMHFYELALPAILLTALGLQRLDRAARRLDLDAAARFTIPALTAALILSAWIGYAPVRFQTIRALTEAIAQPHLAVRAAEIERGVIFAPDPFIESCAYKPSVAFLFSRPNNDPALENDILWVNHLNVELDRRLLREHFPDREGWIMRWDERCGVELLPLDEVRPGMVTEVPSGMVLDVR